MSKVKLAFVGDTMAGDLFYNMGSGVRTNLKKHGNDFIDKEIHKIFKDHDIVFCNLESIISDIGVDYTSLRSMTMRGTPDTADKLSSFGINIANVANNHILEHGVDAAIDSVNLLRNSGIDVVGCGRNNLFNNEIGVLKKKISDVNFYFISACFINDKYAYNGGGSRDELLKKISEIERKPGSFLIVSLHWGHEYVDRPTNDQKNFAGKLFDAGVDFIIGHHPHVYQGIKCLDNKLIAYSLGNFMFGGFFKDTDWSVMLSIVIENGKDISYEVLPIFSDKKYRPMLASGDRKKTLISEIQRRDQLINEIFDGSEKLRSEIINNTKQFRKKLKLQILKNTLTGKIKLKFIFGILLRPIQRRIGSW